MTQSVVSVKFMSLASTYSFFQSCDSMQQQHMVKEKKQLANYEGHTYKMQVNIKRKQGRDLPLL